MCRVCFECSLCVLSGFELSVGYASLRDTLTNGCVFQPLVGDLDVLRTTELRIKGAYGCGAFGTFGGSYRRGSFGLFINGLAC